MKMYILWIKYPVLAQKNVLIKMLFDIIDLCFVTANNILAI